MAEYQLFGDTDMTVMEYRNYVSRLQQPLQHGISRERHLSIGSSSARTNSISATTANSVTDSNSEQLNNDRSAGLNCTTLAVSAHLRAKIKQMRNSIPTGSIAGGSKRMFNTLGPTCTNNINSYNSVNMNNSKLTLLEIEFNVFINFCKIKNFLKQIFSYFFRICLLLWIVVAQLIGLTKKKIRVGIVFLKRFHSTLIALFYYL